MLIAFPSPVTLWAPVIGIAEKLNRDRSIAQGVLAQKAHDLVQGCSGGLVFVEQVPS